MYGKLLVSEMSADITVPMDRSRTGRSAGRRILPGVGVGRETLSFICSA